jgi:hypothetical protein
MKVCFIRRKQMNQVRIFTCISIIALFSFFIAQESLSSEKTLATENAVKGEQEKVAKEDAFIKKKYPNAIRTSSGLMYIILKEGNGATPTSGALVEAHYTGRLPDYLMEPSLTARWIEGNHCCLWSGQVE